jgi:hypothetical protein
MSVDLLRTVRLLHRIFGFLAEQTTEPLVADVMARKGRSLPEFVHVHPEENVGAAIADRGKQAIDVFRPMLPIAI